jgi:hypothetical protein
VARGQTALFKTPVCTALKTLFISVIKTNQFMLYVAQAQTALFKAPVCTALKTLSISVIKPNQFML